MTVFIKPAIDLLTQVFKLIAPGQKLDTHPAPARRATDNKPGRKDQIQEFAATRTLEWKERKEAHDAEHIAPVLRKLYGNRRDLRILEVGPLTTTLVARTMQAQVRQYIGLDCSKALVNKQAEFLEIEGIHNARSVVGDVYCLPFEANCQDLVYASRITPLCEWNPDTTGESLSCVYSEIARVLKSNGEFVMFPGPEPAGPNCSIADEFFDKVQEFKVPSPVEGQPPETLVVFRKRPSDETADQQLVVAQDSAFE